jgi:gluconate 2-dehydrogenase alpha chain
MEIAVDAEGKASGVEYVRDGERYFQPARLVVLATYTYENVRLLLLSRSKAFPTGLANRAGQVGRHFMTHSLQMALGLFPGKIINGWSGSSGQGTAVDEFDGDNFTPEHVPRWGAVRKQWLAENLRSVGWGYTMPDCLPYEDEFLDLDPSVKDKDGVPVVRVTYGLRENERRQAMFLVDRFREWFTAMGASEFWAGPVGANPISTHAYGGTRMGADPDTSVVDPWGFSHDVPNLVIAGASTFPTSSGLNPTETVEAVTWRTVDHILAEWERLTT